MRKLKEVPESGPKKSSKKTGKKQDTKVEAEGIEKMQKNTLAQLVCCCVI